MQILKTVLIIIDFIICFAVTILAVIQSKNDAGLSSALTGRSTSNFYEKNKGRTKEGKQKKWTVILGIAFAIVSISLSIVYIV